MHIRLYRWPGIVKWCHNGVHHSMLMPYDVPLARVIWTAKLGRIAKATLKNRPNRKFIQKRLGRRAPKWRSNVISDVWDSTSSKSVFVPTFTALPFRLSYYYFSFYADETRHSALSPVSAEHRSKWKMMSHVPRRV